MTRQRSICFFGIYDPAYARNRVLMRGFRENGYDIVECRVDPHQVRGVMKYVYLFQRYREVRHLPFNLILVAFPGHTVVWFARLLFGRRIIFDAFVSLYDSNVCDRKTHSPKSVAALLDRFWDWSSVSLAQTVLLDTEQHIDYFVRTYSVSREKIVRVWVGTDDAVFYPRPAVKSSFVAHFHGRFIPLHGIRYIIEAAHILRNEPIEFRLVGKGQEYEKIRDEIRKHRLTNVSLIDAVPYERLPEFIASASACLGIFGDTDKTTRVIPNKVYEYLAMGEAIITADTPAIRGLSIYGELPMVLVPPADAAALAQAIRKLRDEPEQRRSLGVAAHAFYEAHFTPVRIVADLLAHLPDNVVCS